VFRNKVFAQSLETCALCIVLKALSRLNICI